MKPSVNKSIVDWVVAEQGRSVTIAHHRKYDGAFSESVVITAYSLLGDEIVTCNCAFDPRVAVDPAYGNSADVLAAAAWDAIVRSYKKAGQEGGHEQP